MKFDIGEVLIRAWQITWKHKILWILAMLPTALGFLYIPLMIISIPWGDTDFFHSAAVMNAMENPDLQVALLAGMIVLFLLIMAAQLVMNAALTAGLLRAESGTGKQGFIEVIKLGAPYIGRFLAGILVIVLVSLVVFVVYTACFIVVSIATKGIGIIFAQFLVYPIMFVTWIIWEQAQTAIVADEMGGPAALVRAWDLVRDNIPAFIILGVLVYFAQAIVSSILFIPIFMPLWGVMFSSTITETVPDMKILWVSMLCVLAITPVYAFVMGIFKTYSRSVFVIIYRRLTRDSEARQELLQALGSKEIK